MTSSVMSHMTLSVIKPTLLNGKMSHASVKRERFMGTAWNIKADVVVVTAMMSLPGVSGSDSGVEGVCILWT